MYRGLPHFVHWGLVSIIPIRVTEGFVLKHTQCNRHQWNVSRHPCTYVWFRFQFSSPFSHYSALLRAQAAPFRGLVARNISLASQPTSSTLLRCTPVLATSKQCKGSTSEEVRLKAQEEMQEYWEKNMKLKRPWSPHLTIYSPPFCMRTSFLHRATGIAMAAGEFLPGWDVRG